MEPQSNQPRPSDGSNVYSEVEHDDLRTSLRLPRIKGNSARQINDYIQSDKEHHGDHFDGSFNSVTFNKMLDDFDSKYVRQGKYGATKPYEQDMSELGGGLVARGFALPRLRSKDAIGSSCDDVKALDQHSKCRLSQEPQVMASSPSEPECTDGDESSRASLDEENSPASEDPDQRIEFDISSRKRKREQWIDRHQYTVFSVSASPTVLSPDNAEHPLCMSDPMFDPTSPTGFTSASDQILPKIPNSKPEYLVYEGNDKIFIQIAQILVDQIVWAPEVVPEPPLMAVTGCQLSENSTRGGFDDPLPQILSKIFPCYKRCDLKSYAILHGPGLNFHDYSNSIVDSAAKHANMVRNEQNAKSFRNNVFKLEPPYTCISRAEKSIEVTSSALVFWEELGLGPAYSTKDVSAFCMFPAHEYIKNGAITFLSMMSSAYHSCKLGIHDHGSLHPEQDEGLVPVVVNGLGVKDFLEEICRTCEKLGKLFTTSI